MSAQNSETEAYLFRRWPFVREQMKRKTDLGPIWDENKPPIREEWINKTVRHKRASRDLSLIKIHERAKVPLSYNRLNPLYVSLHQIVAKTKNNYLFMKSVCKCRSKTVINRQTKLFQFPHPKVYIGIYRSLFEPNFYNKPTTNNLAF